MRILAARAYAEIERLRAEVAIREGEERLASILGSAMDAIITFDASRTIEIFNNAAEKIFRCSAAQAIGRTLDPFLTDALRNVIDQFIGKSDSNAAGAFVWAPGGLIAKRADGQVFPVEATISQVSLFLPRLGGRGSVFKSRLTFGPRVSGCPAAALTPGGGGAKEPEAACN
jgi:formate hydrogenlyase transcriptional activator